MRKTKSGKDIQAKVCHVLHAYRQLHVAVHVWNTSIQYESHVLIVYSVKHPKKKQYVWHSPILNTAAFNMLEVCQICPN